MRRAMLLPAAMLAALLLAGDVASAAGIQGTPGDDTLSGTAEHDHINGEEGDDTIRGLGAVDTLFGDYGNDTLYGGDGDDNLVDWSLESDADGRPLYSGDDRLYGEAGNDDLESESGADFYYGGTGVDRITTHGRGGNDAGTFVYDTGVDRVFAGANRDFVFADDGVKDHIDCQTNPNDVAFFDEGLDVVVNCEKLNPR